MRNILYSAQLKYYNGAGTELAHNNPHNGSYPPIHDSSAVRCTLTLRPLKSRCLEAAGPPGVALWCWHWPFHPIRAAPACAMGPHNGLTHRLWRILRPNSCATTDTHAHLPLAQWYSRNGPGCDPPARLSSSAGKIYISSVHFVRFSLKALQSALFCDFRVWLLFTYLGIDGLSICLKYLFQSILNLNFFLDITSIIF